MYKILNLILLVTVMFSSNSLAEQSFTIHIPTRTENLMVGYSCFISNYFVETNLGIDFTGIYHSDNSSHAINMQLYATAGLKSTFHDLQILYGIGMFYNRIETRSTQHDNGPIYDYWGGVVDSDIRKEFENYFLNVKIRIHAFNTFEKIDFQYRTSVTPFLGIGSYF